MTYDQATDKLFADGYPQQMMEYLTGQGTSPEWGWATGGTPADNARAKYLADELRSMGLKVRLEPVPVDVLTFNSASVIVGSTVLHASPFGGVAPTPLGGVTGEVVYVGRGGDAGYLPGVSVRRQARPRRRSDHGADLDVAALGSGRSERGGRHHLLRFERQRRLLHRPVVDRHAAQLVLLGRGARGLHQPERRRLAQGGAGRRRTTTATLVNDIEYTYAEDGGVGYNLVATMPGKHRGTRTIVSAHRDAYWHSALDDTAGCVSAVVMAKAMKMAGYKPDHDLVIFLTTNEEWGAA